jgi:hypothetical protein
MPTCFQAIEYREKGQTVSDGMEDGGAPFPVPTYPTAHLFVKLGLTRSKGKYNFNRYDVAASVPFDQTKLDEVYAAVKRWVSGQLFEIDGSGRLNPSLPFPSQVAEVKTVPAGATVEVSAETGRTVSLKDMESARVDLGLTLLADPGKAADAHAWAFEWVESTVEGIVKNIKASMA